MRTQSDEPTQRGQGELPKRPLAPNVTWREPMESGEFDKGSINAIAWRAALATFSILVAMISFGVFWGWLLG
jgi:hypothetical protein